MSRKLGTITVLAADRPYKESPNPGEPACICSRCACPIEENETPLRCGWGEVEFVYCPDCARRIDA
jgi:hypothetical protein